MTPTSRAIVIGGGIAGPAVALFLQRIGIEPLIFEAYPHPATIGGGFQIAPNGMRVLRALGLADEIATAGMPSSEFAFRNQRGRELGRIDLSRSGVGVTIERTAFQRILLAEIARRGLSIAYGKRLTNIEARSDRVVAHFGDGEMLEGAFLVASDGVHSHVRRLLFPQHAQPRYTGAIGVGGFAAEASATPTDPHDGRRLNFTIGARLQFGYAKTSTAGPRWGWWTHLPQPDELTRQELQSIPDQDMRERLLQAFDGWHPPIEAMVSTTPQIMRTAIYDVPPLPAWHVGRVMLMGDAAHAMSPAGGQGASLALEDAMLLGQGFVEPNAEPEAVFTEVESRLRQRAERIVRAAHDNDIRQLKQLGATGQWIRDRLFPVFTPLIARALERQYREVVGAPASAA